MAESAIAFLLGKVDQLASVALREAALVWGVKDELRKLQRTLKTIRAVIMDAEQRQNQENGIRIWIEDLTDVLQDSENVLDEFECEALRKQVVKQENTTAAKVRHFCSSSSNPLAFRVKMARKLKKIRERLDEIRDRKDTFNLNAQLLPVDRSAVSGRRLRRQESTHSFVHASDIIGRDEDEDVIVEQLLHPNASKKNPFVISVVGMGGLGKTALAKVVYNDERVKDLFQLRIWVCVSEDFSLKELVQKIITSVTKEKVDHFDVDSLQKRLREILKDERFLLVLDDVWNENGRKWSDLQDLLKDGAEGSSVMVTTRSSKVASAAGSSYKRELKGLSHESCMSMLKKVLQDHGEDKAMENPSRLLKIANEIVGKCGGVPLVVKALAGLLCSKIDEKFWERIRDKDMWEELKKEDNILPIIRLSYDHLSPELKRCFAFCSIFPKDSQFYSLVLTCYWAANGLVDTSSDDKEDGEDVAGQYIKDLMERSFFQEFEDVGFTYRFKMHDIVHDLALSISKTECAIVSSDHPPSSERVRHLSFIDNDTDLKESLLTNKLQTVIFRGDANSIKESFLQKCIPTCPYLRVLDLTESVFEDMPKSIGTLKHLRYFSVDLNTKIKRLPESICNLQSLQVLSLQGCESLEELPRNMRKLISLRRLYITTKQRSLRTSGIEYLRSLRHLVVDSCNNVESLFEGMDMNGLSGLRGLFISNCESLISLPLCSLKNMTSLETLVIGYCMKLDLSRKEDIQIQFSSLRTLALQVLLLPEWVQGTTDTLRTLIVKSCSELPEWLGNFKNLEILSIWNCPNISNMPDGIHNLISLKDLEIVGCGELGERCQPPNGPDWHKIAHIPLIIIDGKKIECVGAR